MTGSSRLSCPGIVSGTTWCSIGQRREKGRVQQGGARHCRISVKIRRLLRKNTQTWVLSSVLKEVPWLNLFLSAFEPVRVPFLVPWSSYRCS